MTLTEQIYAQAVAREQWLTRIMVRCEWDEDDWRELITRGLLLIRDRTEETAHFERLELVWRPLVGPEEVLGTFTITQAGWPLHTVAGSVRSGINVA